MLNPVEGRIVTYAPLLRLTGKLGAVPGTETEEKVIVASPVPLVLVNTPEERGALVPVVTNVVPLLIVELTVNV